MTLVDTAVRFGVALLAAVVAAYSFRWTVRHARTAIRTARTDATDLATLSRGPVAASGVARATDDDGLLEAPVTGTDCLAYAYRVSRDTAADLTDLAPKQKGAEAVPFRLDGETGSALVRPVERDGSGSPTEEWESMQLPGIDCPQEFDEDIYQLFGQEVPDRVEEMVPRAIEQNQEVYVTERRLEPGTEVFVLGTVGDTASPPAIENCAGDPFTVTAGDRGATVRRYALAAAGNAALGLAAGLLAVVLATPPGTVLARF